MSEGVKKVGVVAATLMVAGNIMGSGVFMLPASLAGTGGIAIFGWMVTIIGAMSLSLVYAKFASFEEGAGGSYAYVKKAFGPYMGYQTNMVYWLAGWVGNIAMAVVGSPRVLLLDEPTSGISVEEKFVVMDVVMSALKSRKLTVLFVEHDMEIVARFADRVLAFYDGTVIADGAPAAALADRRVQTLISGTKPEREGHPHA